MKIWWIVTGFVTGFLGALSAVALRHNRLVAELSESFTTSTSDGTIFREEMVEGLPDPARRYYLHAISPGTPLATRLRWSYAGAMRPGKDMPWMSLRATQVLVSRKGFVWKAFARKGPLFVTAVDHYLDGRAGMRIALFGLLPVVNAGGEDIARSTLGRLLVEGVALPSTFLPGPDVSIEGIDDSSFRVTIDLHGERTPLTLTVDDTGRLLALEMLRWGNVTTDGSFQYIPYGATFTGERTFDGYTIPTDMAIGWWYGTPDYLEAIRIRIESAQLN